MGGGVSASSCVENFEKLESEEGNLLTDAQREHLKNIAEDVLKGASTPLEIEKNLDMYRNSVDGTQKHDIRDQKFLKYLAVEVMKVITRQAIEDAMETLLSGSDKDYTDDMESGGKVQDALPTQEGRKK